VLREQHAEPPDPASSVLEATRLWRNGLDAMSSDPLSDVLRLTEARSVMSGGYAIGGRWGFRSAAPGVVVFAAIAQGSCWLRLDGEKEATKLEAGDVGLLSGRDGWVIGSTPNPQVIDVPHNVKKPPGIVELGPTRDCVVLFGRVSLDPSCSALLTDVLPPSVHVRASSPTAASLRWVIEALVTEQVSARPGASVASEKLAELLFVQILRSDLAGTALPPGWLRAMRNERIVRALRSMHDDPTRAWTLSELAQTAAMSRTRFAVAFKSAAGVAPLTYLTEWRMRLAQRALRKEGTPIRQLAEALGYASESAFSSAFKRVVGVAPRSFRNASTAAA
jgi:AraC-like DNA-binding protein